uniref:SCP domain-containing protein n=1 Tax=Ascaris lumbricoides TaxID=6252 RepID=A0A0M3HM62_ASCLU
HWDCDLENKAQKWADLCLFEHSPVAFREAGENLYEFLTSKDMDPVGRFIDGFLPDDF